jgi:outer membrane protein insertion porin family
MGLTFVFLMAASAQTLFISYARAEDSESKRASEAAPIVSKILVEIRDAPGDAGPCVEMARNLIFLAEGERFSPVRLQKSIDALKACKRFHKIDVDSEEEQGAIRLIFRLSVFRLIKDIKIDGQFPLFERQVLNAMTMQTGKAFIEEELPQQQASISELFQGEGFFSPAVEITAVEDRKDGNFVIHVNIKKGPYYTLNRLTISGNNAFSDSRLKLKMKTWLVSILPASSGRFIEENLKQDIKNLIAYYWKKQYPEAAIDYKLEMDAGTRGVCVFVTIHEGRRYEIAFIGNKKFWDRTLKKDLILFDKGITNDLRLRRSMRNIGQRYRKAGYLETRIRLEDDPKSNGSQTVRMLRLVIDEGPCSVVDSIRISGNTAFDDEKIRKQMLTRLPGFREKGLFVPETLEDDLNMIKALYQKHGYMDVEVGKEVTWSEDRTRAAIHVEIHEGVQTLVSSVRVSGVTLVSEKEVSEAIRLKPGEPFRKYMIRSDENALSALIAEKGYPYINVQGDFSLSADHSQAQVGYTVDEGPYVEMGQAYYAGNLRTKEKILQNELGIQEGEPFSLIRMLQGQRNIRNLELFNAVEFKEIGLKEKEEKINLFVAVEEKKPYFLQVGGGYDSERGFFGHTRIGDHNLFGSNKDGWVGGEVSQIGYRGESGIREPRLLGSRISATLGASAERREEFNQDFGTKTYGSSLLFERKWFQHLTAGLGLRYDRREQFRRDSDGLGPDALVDDDDVFAPRSILVTTPSLIYDSRDSLIRPRKGTLCQLSVDLSKGLSNELDDFIKYRLDLRYYWTPLHRLTFAWLGRAGYIDPYGSMDRVPDDQLFFLGGTSDVRGFEENMLRYDANRDPVGGRSAVAGSVEARVDLGRNFELTGFYDAGTVRESYDETSSNEFRDSVGLGLRYMTAVGPIGLLYGIKIDPQKGESPGRWHFSIGYTF